MITSIQINGLEVGDSSDYFVTIDSIAFLNGSNPEDPILVARGGTYPAYIRSQPREKAGSLTVGLLGVTLQDRDTAYAALKAVVDMSGGLIPVVWVEVLGSTLTHTLLCHLSGPDVDEWRYRAVIAAMAPAPATVA